jgi:acyl carrier protein
MEDIKNSILDALKTTLELDDQILMSLTDDEHLANHGFNSMTSIQFILNLEKKFKIRVAVDDLVVDKFSTINNIKATLQRYL